MSNFLSLLKEAIEDHEIAELNKKRIELRKKIFKAVKAYLAKYPKGSFVSDANETKQYLFEKENEIESIIKILYSGDLEGLQLDEIKGNIEKIIKIAIIELGWIWDTYSDIDALKETKQ